MNYLLKMKDLTSAAYFFCKKYGYKFDACSEKIEGMGCAYIKLSNETLPKITIEMERYNVCFYVEVGENMFKDILCIYKYFHPKEILRNYHFYKHRKNNFRNYFVYDIDRYYSDFLKRKDSFDYKTFNEFYTSYPVHVWNWIEK